MNDFAGLYISYYMVHSLELIIIGFMLFIGSVACITLYMLINTSKKTNYNNIMNFMTLYTKLYNVLFLRKQTLHYQSFRRDVVREVYSNDELSPKDKVDN